MAPTIGENMTDTSDVIPLIYAAVVLGIPYLVFIHWLKFKYLKLKWINKYYHILAKTGHIG